MRTIPTRQEPCTLGLVLCGSRVRYVSTRGHAWCADCGAKKPVPANMIRYVGSNERRPRSTPLYPVPHAHKADATGEP